MADTTFVDNVLTAANRIVAAWLNQINNYIYRGSNPIYVTSTGTANAQVITLPSSLKTSLSAGDAFTFKAGVTLTNTGAMTLEVVGQSSLGVKDVKNLDGSALDAGAVVAGGIFTVVYDGTNFILQTAVVTTARIASLAISTAKIAASAVTYAKIQNVAAGRLLGNPSGSSAAPSEIPLLTGGFFQSSSLVFMPRNYLSGFTMSTAGSSATMAIAAGWAWGTTGNNAIISSSAISKTTSAWAAGTGNGGLDTGAIANNTWYAFYAIYGSSGVDITFSTNGTTPTLPSGYDSEYRRIGWGLTNGAAQWVKFVQDGDRFMWDVPVSDLNDNAVATTRVTLAVTAAPSCDVLVNMGLASAGAGLETVLLTALAQTDTAPSATLFSGKTGNAAAGGGADASGPHQIKLDSSRQLGYRRNTASTSIQLVTIGWVDRRSKG